MFKADDSPELHSVPVTWVKAGSMVRLGRRQLQAHYKGVGANDIVYTILDSDEQPKYGKKAFIGQKHVTLKVYLASNRMLIC